MTDKEARAKAHAMMLDAIKMLDAVAILLHKDAGVPWDDCEHIVAPMRSVDMLERAAAYGVGAGLYETAEVEAPTTTKEKR